MQKFEELPERPATLPRIYSTSVQITDEELMDALPVLNAGHEWHVKDWGPTSPSTGLNELRWIDLTIRDRSGEKLESNIIFLPLDKGEELLNSIAILKKESDRVAMRTQNR